MEDYNEYMGKYMLERYHTQREEAIEYLGGKCIQCGSTEELEIDHIDPSTKEVSLAKSNSYSEERFWKEIEKCQLLCKPCHVKKTIQERGQTPARGNHGTISSYRYCKCQLCRDAKAKYMREYRSRMTIGE